MTSKKFLPLVLMLSSAAVITACGGGGGSSDSTTGTDVQFNAQHLASTAPQGAGAKTVINTEGVTVTLNKAYVTLWSVEMQTDCSASSFAALGEGLLEFLIPSASAHADDSPTLLGTPHVINLLTADSDVLALGNLSPAAGDYCGVEAALFPADEDAVGLPTDVNMDGKTLYIEGTYQVGSGDATSFTIDLSTRALEKGLSFPALLQLSSSHLTDSRTIKLSYERWFDGLDFAQIDTAGQQDQVLTNVRNSLSVN